MLSLRVVRPASGLSGSTMPRADACKPSVVLPRVREAEDHEFSSRGKVIHDFLATVGEIGMEAALENVPETFEGRPVDWREVCAAMDPRHYPGMDGKTFATEVAFFYDVEKGTAREVGRNIDRDYSALAELGPYEIPLTVDVVGLTEDGEGVVVEDYKTGYMPVPPAQRNWQLRLGCLAAARAYGRSYAVAAIVRVPPDGGKPFVDHARFDAFDLGGFAVELQDLLSTIQEMRRDYAARGLRALHTFTIGHWCRYCPAMAFCPAQQSLLHSLSTAPEEIENALLMLVSPQKVGEAWNKLKAMRKILDVLEDKLRDYAAKYPVPIGDNKVLSRVRKGEEEIVPVVARSVLKGIRWPEHLAGLAQKEGQEVADAATTWTVTKASIERAMRLVAPKGKLGAFKVAALDAIRAAGGVAINYRESVVENYADPKALPPGPTPEEEAA